MKQILRQQIRQILKAMSSDDRLAQSQLVTRALLQHPKYLSSNSISIYVHMQTEISTRDVIQHALQMNKQVFIPRYSSNSMDMVRVYSMEDLDSLPMTKWKIQQPSLDDSKREIATNRIDLVIVPGLAFSFDGSRLGHGKGFYDRYLRNLHEHTYTIGLAFHQQILENNVIPMNSTDVPIEEILIAKNVKH